MLQTKGWRDLPGVGREAAAEPRTYCGDPGSPLLSCRGLGRTQPAEVCTGTSSPPLPGGHQGVPSSGPICAWLPKCQRSFIRTSRSTSGPSGVAGMVRDAQRETHVLCPKPRMGLGCGDRWLWFSRCSIFYSRCSSDAARDTLQN